MSLWSRIGNVFRGDRINREIAEEFESHIEEAIAEGRDPAEARRSFGPIMQQRETSHGIRVAGWLESFVQDTAYGVRSMLRSKALIGVALLSLALGIGANTAIFSLLDAVLLRMLPVKEPQRLMLLGTARTNGVSDAYGFTELFSYPFYRELQKQNSVFSDTAAMFSMKSDIHGFIGNETSSVLMKAQLVSGTYFSTLGMEAGMGRLLSDADDSTEGDHPVVVVSDAWWKRAMGKDPAVLGRTLKIGPTVFTIVGVAPAEFFGTMVGDAPDLWIPFSMVKAVPPYFDGYKNNFAESLYIFGRMKPSVTPEQATANVNVLFRLILLSFTDRKPDQRELANLNNTHVPLTSMGTGLSRLRRQFSEPLQMLMGIVALVLLIACTNIANLLLARATARARELAVRQALGAQRGRIIRQLLTESLVLSFAGGALGIAFAMGASRLLLRMVSSGPEVTPLNVGLNTTVLLFTLGITVATALLFGTIPAFRATRVELTETLKEGRGMVKGGTKNLLARTMVVLQVALSLALVVGASLFLRSLINLTNVDTGFNRENVLRLNIDPSSVDYKDGEPRLTTMFEEIEAKVSALPGVHAASFSDFVFHEGSWNGWIVVPGAPVNYDVQVKHDVVGNSFFATMQIPLIAGRTFVPQDTAKSPHVAIINEHMAKTFFPEGSPIGKSYHMGTNDSPVQIIGVVKDAKFGSLDETPQSIDYIPYLQHPQYVDDLSVRYTGDFNAIADAVQQTIHSIDRSLPITDVTTLDEQVQRSVTNQRVVAQLSIFFGLLAVFLSCIGIYGLMSYIVSQRTNEIGIRMALGAPQSNVRWLVLREIAVMVLVGIAIGVPATLAGGRLVTHMLFGLKDNDPASIALAVGVLLVVGLIAGYFPARRASRVDPMIALRYE
ncbi:ABC transporter permease [Terracidiphilus gabretensis]|uniref:ABC transporter permease n=1 Tax=Terracidiphilus gabretensis TaxID=1577687 RepID=UPI00071B7AC1|nr:ABC transporter permease [Terracidiphilus gabretensis]